MIQIEGKKLISILAAISKTNTATKNETDSEELNTIRIIGGNNALQLIATSKKVDVAYKLNVLSMNSQLSATLNNKGLDKALSAIVDNDGNLTLDSVNGNIVAAGNGSIILEPLEPKKKLFPSMKNNSTLSFIADDLIKAITSTSYATGSDGILSKIKVSINIDEPFFKLLGFNGSLMCEYNIPLEDISDDAQNVEFLIDGKTLKTISTALSLIKSEIVDLIIDDDKIEFSSGDLKIVIPISREPFIKCEGLLNEEFDKKVTFNVKKLKKSVNAISKASSGNVKFDSDGVSHTFSAKGFSQPAEVENSTPISFVLPIGILKNMIGCICDANIAFETTEKGLIKTSPELSEDVVFITAGCK